MNLDSLFHSKLLRFGISVAAVLLATAGLASLAEHVNLITVSLSLLLIVLASATFFGRNPALLASFVAMLCFNYFRGTIFKRPAIADAPANQRMRIVLTS